jgi:hypothetical protein
VCVCVWTETGSVCDFEDGFCVLNLTDDEQTANQLPTSDCVVLLVSCQWCVVVLTSCCHKGERGGCGLQRLEVVVVVVVLLLVVPMHVRYAHPSMERKHVVAAGLTGTNVFVRMSVRVCVCVCVCVCGCTLSTFQYPVKLVQSGALSSSSSKVHPTMNKLAFARPESPFSSAWGDGASACEVGSASSCQHTRIDDDGACADVRQHSGHTPMRACDNTAGATQHIPTQS